MRLDEFSLRDGEELLWSDRPPSELIFRRKDIFLVPFSILWTSFAIFWTLIVYSELWPGINFDHFEPESLPFLIIGPVFVTVGLLFTVGRFFFDSARRAKTRYAITNKRAIIQSGARGRDIDSMPITAALKIRVKGRKTGDILFGEERGAWDVFSSMGGWWGPDHPFMFERVKDVRAVYDLILGVQEKSSR